MHVEQLYTGCLAQGAYYIQSKGEAAIIDPLREVDQYIDRAEMDGVNIKYIFETHFHADFVSGHVTLSEKTGAPIIYGPTANPNFEAVIAEDGQEFELGDVKIKVLHTPGHTMESSTYLLIDENGKEHAIFSGDTLFLGDVGRPDLAQKAAHMTQEELAGMLYHSLRDKIMPLPNDVTVYPGHGAGSACGKNMMKETVDTLGNQKQVNYALRENMTEEEFIREVTDGLLPPPAYFPENVRLNKEGYESIDNILQKGAHPLTAKEFYMMVEANDALVIDVRNREDYSEAHIPGSIYIGLDGEFAPWVGALIKDVNQALVIVAPEGKEQETVTRLARVGFDHTLGYLKGGIEAWINDGREVDSLVSVSADKIEDIYEGQPLIFDVRRSSEYEAEHIEGAINTPLDYINDYMNMFKDASDKPFYLHCKSGYRSIIACSIMKSRGFHNLYDVKGGFDALAKTSLPKTEYVCPTTLAKSAEA
jgi:glyoxylase-like metal-dependent hydrolase (beta-lactamase superfamily II)/rhodanese-related sulfurtransferase